MNEPTDPQFDRLGLEMERQIDAICRRFEADWRAGKPATIAGYLAEIADEGRPKLRAELAVLESELRQSDQALKRPKLTDAPASPLDSTVAEEPTIAPCQPPTEPLPGAATSPIREQASLLAAGDATVDLGSADPARPEARSPTRIRYFGDYEIVREIARGGMGIVYQARQISLNRTVALKTILAGQLADDHAVRRFYIEAEAAASLDHPGIVPIYEVGEHEGQHYFSMGFVQGESLSRQIANGPLPSRRAAEIVRRVALAIEFAHDRGVIHRDLKPANILLDSEGNPRVTDFGLAKKVEADSGLTGSGQIMGTPSYMPPEQARGDRASVGPSADVYALGATLYALVTGRPPFQAASVMDTILQVLNEEPVPPRRLDPSLNRDLQTICLKCLEKEPARRYASAAALGEDLRRFLVGEPVLARPVGRLERAWRWCRRNPVVAGLTASLALALVIGFVGITWGWLEARRQRSQAEQNFRQAEQNFQMAMHAVDDYLTRVSESRVLRVPGLEPLRRELLEDALRFYQGFVQARAHDPSVRDELMRAYERVGQINDLVGTSSVALEAYQQSLKLADELAATRPGDQTIQGHIANLHNRIGLIEMRSGKTDQAFQSIKLARSINETLAQAHPAERGFQSALAGSMHNLGMLLEATGRPAEGLEPLKQAFAVYEKMASAHPGEDPIRIELAHTGRGIGNLLSDLGRTKEAMEHYLRSREILEKLLQAHPDDTEYADNLAGTCNEIGMLLGEQGLTTEAVTAYRRARDLREALARSHPAVIEYRRGLAHTLHQMGLAYVHGHRGGEGVEPFTAARVLFEKLVRDHPENLDFQSSLGGTLNDLGLALAHQDQHAEAVEVYNAAIEHQRLAHERAPTASTYTRFLANHYRNLAEAELALDRAPAAVDACGRARALREELVHDHPEVDQFRLEQAQTEQFFGSLLARQNSLGEALPAYTRACDLLEALVRARPDDLSQRSALGGALNDLGRTLAAVGRHKDAYEAYDRAIEHQRIAHERAPDVPQYLQFLANHYANRGQLQEQLGETPAARESWIACRKLRESLARSRPEVAAYRDALANLIHHIGMFELRAGKPAEALGLLEDSRALQEQLLQGQPGNPNFLTDLGGVLNDCGMALAALGRHEDALQLYQTAITHQRRVLGSYPRFPRSRRFLSIHYQSLSQSLRALGQPSEAAEAAHEGLRTRSDDPGYVYDMACELSLCVSLGSGKDDEAHAGHDRYARWAVDALRQAVTAGFRDFAHMRVDKDLDPLRGRTDFQLLMMDFAFPPNPFADIAHERPGPGRRSSP
jgi:tetratricopeptide (TPR) repeat protein